MTKKLRVTFELEADDIEARLLEKALQRHPGAHLMVRHYTEFALERVLRDVYGEGAWAISVVGGRLQRGGPDA
jgi:hypothetical protein